MSTADRRLLELAAKAAGIELTWHEPDDGEPWCFVPRAKAPHNRRESDKMNGTIWNPFEDDGDALRLAVKLGLNLYLSPEGQVDVDGDSTQREEFGLGDPYAATRRAIVRAAAAIGESMP